MLSRLGAQKTPGIGHRVVAEPPPHALSRQDLSSGCILALKVMEMELLKTPVLCSVFYFPNTFSATQAYGFIIRGFFLWLRFFSLLGNANKYARRWTVKLFILSFG